MSGFNVGKAQNVTQSINSYAALLVGAEAHPSKRAKAQSEQYGFVMHVAKCVATLTSQPTKSEPGGL